MPYAASLTGHRGMAPRTPIFLERATYRRRRAMDAARLLPVLGVVLFAVPLLWNGSDGGLSMARAGLYLFSVWAILLVLAALLARRLGSGGAQDRGQGE